MAPARSLAGLGVICLAFLAGAGWFAAHQAVWIDETTQLSGLALPPDVQLSWLLGRSGLDLGVPPDRMPPLSYWVGSVWAALFGLSEMSMRRFGIVAVLAAAPALYLAGRMRGGEAGGLFAVAVVLLSPGLLVMAGEIRAYPLFLSLSAWSVLAFLRCLDPAMGNRPGRLAALSVLLVLTGYAHFFGVVLAAVLFATLLAERMVACRPWLPVLLAGLASLVLLTGLLPFVLAAVTVSGGGGAAGGSSLREVVVALARLGFRLFLHGSHGVYPAILLATGLALAGLAVLALAGALRPARDRAAGVPGLWLLVPLVLAGIGLPLLDLRIGSFEVLAPHYNLWMVPLVAVFLAGAFAAQGRAMSRVARGLGVLAILGHLAAGAILLRHAPLYSHGPGEWLAARWQAAPGTVILHDGSGLWAAAYFPLHYLSGGAAVQRLQGPDGTISRIRPGGLEALANPQAVLSGEAPVLRVRVEEMDNAALARIIRGTAACAPLAPAGLDGGPVETFCSYAAAAVGNAR